MVKSLECPFKVMAADNFHKIGCFHVSMTKGRNEITKFKVFEGNKVKAVKYFYWLIGFTDVHG